MEVFQDLDPNITMGEISSRLHALPAKFKLEARQ
jgi:hypothetical protein